MPIPTQRFPEEQISTSPEMTVEVQSYPEDSKACWLQNDSASPIGRFIQTCWPTTQTVESQHFGFDWEPYPP